MTLSIEIKTPNILTLLYNARRHYQVDIHQNKREQYSPRNSDHNEISKEKTKHLKPIQKPITTFDPSQEADHHQEAKGTLQTHGDPVHQKQVTEKHRRA